MIDSCFSIGAVNSAIRSCLFVVGATFVVACNAVEPESGEMNPAQPQENAADAAGTANEPSFPDAEKNLRLDFNGDGAEDRVYLLPGVSLDDSRFEQARPLDLWTLDIGQDQPPAAGKKLRVFLVEFSTAGDAAPSRFLLFSEGDVSFLDSVSADDVTLITRKALVADYPELADVTKGDGLSILTEAGIDTFIYWNGESFEFYEPEEIP
jgi:hypothetical protein